ncbi:MAG: DNA-binding transcriptional regulator CytR [Anaerolineae bacterium]
MARTTIAEIAQQLGVSKTTVSLALRNQPGVSEDTRQAVLEMARRMGYQPKRERARSASGPHSVLFLYTGSVDAQEGISGIGLGYLDGAQTAASDFNLQILIDYLAEDKLVGLSAEMLSARPGWPLGALLVGVKANDDVAIAQARQLNIPLVVVNRYWPESDLSFVSVDYTRAQARAVRYLYQLGHRKIAFVSVGSSADYCWCQQRRDGYLAGLVAEGCPSDPRFIIDAPSATLAVQMLIQQAPETTAICAASDSVAIELIAELKRCGLRVPQDISIIGFDNDQRLPTPDPPLTTIDYDEVGIGYWAVRALVEQSNSKDVQCLHVIMTTDIVERDSCAPPRHTPFLQPDETAR